MSHIEEIEEEDWRGLLALIFVGGFMVLMGIAVWGLVIKALDIAALSTIAAIFLTTVKDVIAWYFKSKERK
mgnify:CR=1 FL=1